MYVVIGSVTAAVRFKRDLERASGYPAYVVHTPSGLGEGGCSYSVRADNRLAEFVKQFCAEKEISVKRICIEEFVSGERVYHDLS